MASPNDYRKPRNKELRDLTWQLPCPLRVKNLKGKVIWQNRAAEELTTDPEWTQHPVSWQNKKATLEIPASGAGPELLEEKDDLEESLERLKRQQRSTARKKRQAESALKRAENALEASQKQEAGLQERLDELRSRNEELSRRLEASEPAEAREPEDGPVRELEQLVERLQKEKQSLEAEFLKFQEKVAEEEAERRLEEQLAAKIEEFEHLERTLEEEQQLFELEKQELQQKLRAQEEEFEQLKVGFESRSTEQRAVPAAELEELKRELEKATRALLDAESREGRLAKKVESMEQLRDDHSRMIGLLKEDLDESRGREKELKDTVKLYGDLRKEINEFRTERDELKEQLSQAQSGQRKLKQDLVDAAEELARYKTGKAAVPGAGESLSVSARNELEFLKKRLADTEKKLDVAHAELRTEKAQNQSIKESERLAFQDSLTGLPNRNMIDRYLQYAHTQARSTGRAIGLFLIDLDGFRVLNNAYGRDWGDSLLRAVGERLNGMRGNTHLVARHSQDRFMLLAADIEDHAARSFADQASRSLLEALAYPFEVEGEEVKLTGSIGASLGPLPGEHSKELYEFAQMALDATKLRSPGSYLVFNEQLKQRMQQETVYKKQMGHAVEKDEFKAVYQPVFDLKKGRVLGLELLMRWDHRDQMELKPSDFLEPAISSGLIFRITEKLWPKAFRRLARWQRMRKGLTLSINLCDKELLSPNLLKRVIGWVREADLDPKSVIFEVRDQSQVRMTSSWWRILQEYAQAGFGLCLDDYGSDSSLFGTLGFHGFTQAKILVDEKSPQFLPSVQAGQRVKYCAKGIQTKFDKKLLGKIGFDMAQGYAVSRPLDASDVEGFLS